MNKSELYSLDLTAVTWAVSSHSHDDDPPDNCVEVADLGGGAKAVRDSTDPSRGVLRFTAAEWAAFTAGVRDGQF